MRKYRDREEKERMTDYGILSLLPVAVVIVLVFLPSEPQCPYWWEPS